jgi:ribonuclease HI
MRYTPMGAVWEILDLLAGVWSVSDSFKLSAGQPNSTNNRMEMTAILRALEESVKRDIQEVRIFTDSNYVKQGINSWIIKWKQNGWMTSAGAPVKNKDLWIAIDETRKKLNVVEWRWVKAHNGDPRNEEADKLARESAKNISV